MTGPIAEGPYCPACGRAGVPDLPGHERCTERLVFDPPRYCSRCARRLDVQVFPTGIRSSCRRCDGVHPAHPDA